MGVMWFRSRAPDTKRAAVFCTGCSRVHSLLLNHTVRECDRPAIDARQAFGRILTPESVRPRWQWRLRQRLNPTYGKYRKPCGGDGWCPVAARPVRRRDESRAISVPLLVHRSFSQALLTTVNAYSRRSIEAASNSAGGQETTGRRPLIQILQRSATAGDRHTTNPCLSLFLLPVLRNPLTAPARPVVRAVDVSNQICRPRHSRD